jgi:hypothetical protein
MRLPDPRERPWLTVAEVADITGEGEKVIRGALDRGQLPRLDIGRYVRIPTHLLLQQLGMSPVASDGPGATHEPTATNNDPDEFTP